MESKWYYRTWFIGLMFASSCFVIPFIVGVLLIRGLKREHNHREKLHGLEVEKLKEELEEAGAYDICKREKAIQNLDKKIIEAKKVYNNIQTEISNLETKITEQASKESQVLRDLKILQEKAEIKTKKENAKLEKIASAYKSVAYAIEHYSKKELFINDIVLPEFLPEFESLQPTVHLKLHNTDLKDLRKMFRDNQKEIVNLFNEYQSKYTTKANRTIYKLMVMALEAELQNILYSLKFSKLEESLSSVKSVTSKYLVICSEGNQQIAVTLTKFIGALEYYYSEAVRIEYEYYLRKEKAKEEQRILREQARQEAEERKILEQQQKRIENEEEKYKNEIANVHSLLIEAEDENRQQDLQDRMTELKEMLSTIEEKKEKIVNLRNGTAGYVYIISNLGSFGENIFKIGMTRRLNPQERVDELGSASVPFNFDVHSFIFSEDAVALEGNIHKLLSANRVNKVNARKEFFSVTIDELEKMVNQLDPAAEFNRTILAEQYRQSLSMEGEELDEILDDDIITEEDEAAIAIPV